jgi:aldose 1-epimerase
MFTARTELVNDIKITFIHFKNEHYEIELSTLGASLYKLLLPNRYGKFEHVLLSFKDYFNIFTTQKYPGLTIGPYAGRIYPLNLKINEYNYKLQANSGSAFLHSYKDNYGLKNFDFKIDKDMIIFTLHPNYLHYPGPNKVVITYTLKNKDLVLTMAAESAHDTYINITNHSYFNLSGDFKDDIKNHNLELTANSYLKVDKNLIPTELTQVVNTRFDLNKNPQLKELINYLETESTKGLDHAYLFNRHRYLKLSEVKSGRVLEIKTDLPAVVLYSNNYPSNAEIIDGVHDYQHAALAIECQYLPNELNLNSKPQTFFKKGSKYLHHIIYKFGIIKE